MAEIVILIVVVMLLFFFLFMAFLLVVAVPSGNGTALASQVSASAPASSENVILNIKLDPALRAEKTKDGIVVSLYSKDGTLRDTGDILPGIIWQGTAPESPNDVNKKLYDDLANIDMFPKSERFKIVMAAKIAGIIEEDLALQFLNTTFNEDDSTDTDTPMKEEGGAEGEDTQNDSDGQDAPEDPLPDPKEEEEARQYFGGESIFTDGAAYDAQGIDDDGEGQFMSDSEKQKMKKANDEKNYK